MDELLTDLEEIQTQLNQTTDALETLADGADQDAFNTYNTMIAYLQETRRALRSAIHAGKNA